MRCSDKKLIAALLVMVVAGHCSLAWSQTAAPSSLPWQPTLEDAKRVAAQTNRLVLVHFWSPSCAPCQQLEQNVFAQPQVQQAVQARFVPVKLNADDWPTTVKAYGVTRLPTDLVITPGGQIVGRMLSPSTAESYLQQLNVAASGTGPAASPVGATYATAAQQSFVVAPAAAASGSAGYGAPNVYADASASPAGQRYGVIAQPQTAAAPATQLTASPADSPPAISAYSDSRYAEFYQRFGNSPARNGASDPGAASSSGAGIAASTATPPSYQSATNPYAPEARYTAPITSAATQYSPPPSVPPQVGWPPSWSAQTPNPAGTTNPLWQSPVASAAPYGMEGYSPVSVIDQQRWQLGDRRWGAIHRGRTYLFVSQDEQQKFLANPDRYAPALSGHDPVVAIDSGREVEGKRQYGVEFADRIYLFSSEASQRIFSQNPTRYATEVLQAESPSRTMIR